MSDPKVSVIISTYNRPQYLHESIQSILNQTMSDWELIILNDGGVDVRPVVEKFADPRIVYVHDSINRGAAVRRNQGIELAKGEYICYLDDDDTFYPNHFESLSKALDENPEAGLAYSDLYAASSVSDNKTGRRHILDKQMMVSRDFNREFMFHYNHVLHVSLMHRRTAALRVGGFANDVKVLIEWSLTRRLAFIYDFVHVEVPTGEYHLAIFKSDRISVRERRNQASYQHNLRKIRCNLPPEPWPKVERIDLLYLVERWGPKLNQHLKEIIDNFDHPMRIKLVANGAGLSLEEAQESLKELAELKNIEIIRIPQKIHPLLAFRKAARQSTAKFLFLVTSALQAVKAPRRLFASMDLFKEKSDLNSIRWGVEGEEKEKTQFECLILRDYFLTHTKPGGRRVVNVQGVTVAPPKGFKFDIMYGEYQRQVKSQDWAKAGTILDAILAEKKGFPHIQYLVNDLETVCLKTKNYDRLEKEALALIERGYKPDNYMRLARLYAVTERWSEVLDMGALAMESLGLTFEDFEADCFPFKLGNELHSFTMFMDMGQASLELRDFGGAARYFHMAAKLKSDSHKPFLGFAKAYMESGYLERAEEALAKMPQPGGREDPESHRVLAAILRKRKNLPLAFECLKKAFQIAPQDEKNVDPFYFTGAGLGRWDDLVEPFKTFALHHENHAGVHGRLASVYFSLNNFFLAREAAEKALSIEPQNPVAKSIMERIKKVANHIPEKTEDSSLELEINPEILPGLLDSAPIVW
ncbi:MAG: glycosyltransferase [Deltaproteobacteria bacterium]|jgi:glycosyltransferase involved in cell wall biosynthesis/tetratricopeptide (TPR) repeat protein|nr:glycosyltransferase [Deltaproteobacteria bacterium]